MAEIVPRWEWRTFGDRFGDAETAFAAQAPERVQESDELYLLSLLGDASVKIRDALMDVKHLQEVNADGLEQWLPVLKGEFPLAAGDVATVIETLGLDRPALEREQYTLDQLLDELVRPDARLRAVEVHKRRERHTIGGCMTELTQISAEGRSTRTIAVELEDPGAVIATVRSLGLGSRANTCLARGLKTLVGFGASRFAVIDVGTNSVKFHVAERRADGSWQTIVDRAEITRLGEGLDAGGRLQPEPVERTLEAIDAMVAEAHSAGVEAIAAVGTAGLRMAPNRADLIDAVRARSGLEIEVISGEDEARLAYLAASAGLALHGGALAVFDTGGGSSQFTFGDGVRVDEQFSVDVGAARFTERFGLDGAVSDEVLADARAAIADALDRLDGRPVPDVLVGMGGATTNLAAVKHQLATYDADVVQGTVLDRAEVDRQIDLYRTRTADERRQIVGLQPKRAEVILAGACIVRTVMEKLGAPALTVSDRALRHGLLVERFQHKEVTPMATTTRQALSDEQLTELIGLIKGADSVELKLTVPESVHRSTISALGLDPLQAQIRQVFFFDTPDLTLNAAGVVVRARRIQGKGADSVVKLRPVVPDELPEELRVSDNFVVEVDAMPGGYVCSGSLKSVLGTVDAREVAAGSTPIRKLFSKEQRRFYTSRAPEGLELDSLVTLGPIFVLKLRITPQDLGRRLVAEMWMYPDGSRILELSTKCAITEAFQVATETRAFLAGRGIDLSGEQETKTKKALEYFAGALAGKQGGASG